MFGTRWKSTIFELQIGYLLLPGFRSWKQNGLYPSKPPRSHPRIHVFSRMRSEGFPFIVWGSGGWTLVRLELLVESASRLRHVVSGGRRRVGVASLIPCLWGKLQNLSFSIVSTQLVMSFCVAGVAFCDIPTRLITCRKCQNWSRSRTKCLVLLRPRVSSRVSGFPVASPCLWGKLQNLSFSKVSTQVVMSFCVAGVALCDIPTCLMTCRKCQHWRKSRTKCSFCSAK